MIELRGISKTYRENGVKALQNASFTLQKGEIYGIAGENGAGKSTLFHILGGFLKPDAGIILLNKKEIHLRSPSFALRSGIGLVRQRPVLAEGFSVWEHCAAETEIKNVRDFFLNKKNIFSIAESFLRETGFNIDLEAKIETLNLAGQKKAAVLALLLHGADFFIFDEPFAYLDSEEKKDMADLFIALKNKGKSVALIAHEIPLLLDIADKITILKKGCVEKTFLRESFNLDIITEAMFQTTFDKNVFAKKTENKTQIDDLSRKKEIIFCAKNLCVQGVNYYSVHNINIELHSVEVLGIEGKIEDGADTLFWALSGYIPAVSGLIEGLQRTASLTPGNINAAAYSTELSIYDNLILFVHRQFTAKNGFLNIAALREFAKTCVKKSGVNTFIRAKASSLSGGSLTRIIIERELARSAKTLIIYGIVSGLDTQSVNMLRQKILFFIQNGGGVIIFLDGAEELRSICETIYNLEKGTLCIKRIKK